MPPSVAMPPAEQLALRRFVERGGTLVVFGGFYAYGHGGYKGSFLEELLPVAIKRTFDLTPIDAPLVGGSAQAPAVGGCAWIHDAVVKPDAEVLYRVAGHPGIVAWNVGNGRVIAVTATVLGDPDEPFWKNPAWPRVLTGTLPEMERR